MTQLTIHSVELMLLREPISVEEYLHRRLRDAGFTFVYPPRIYGHSVLDTLREPVHADFESVAGAVVITQGEPPAVEPKVVRAVVFLDETLREISDCKHTTRVTRFRNSFAAAGLTFKKPIDDHMSPSGLLDFLRELDTPWKLCRCSSSFGEGFIITQG